MRSGVEPPDPASPTGLISTTVRPSWSCDRVTDRLAPTPADVEVRGLALAVGDGEHLVGVKKRNALTRNATVDRDADDDVGRVERREVELGAREDDDRRPR